MQALERFIARVPAPVRSLFFWLAYFAALFAALLLAQFVPHRWFWYAWGVLGSVGACSVLGWFLRAENLNPAQIGLTYERSTIPRFFAGLLGGLTLVSIIFFLLLYFGHLHREPNHGVSLARVLFWSAALIPNALHEELGFRSYTLWRLQNRFGVWIAQAIIALAFALYHFIGGMDLMTALVSTALWSVLYGMATVVTRGIALAVGLHAGGNIGQAIFGIKAGFPAMWSVVANTGRQVPHLQAMALATQAAVLLICIAALGVFCCRREEEFAVR